LNFIKCLEQIKQIAFFISFVISKIKQIGIILKKSFCTGFCTKNKRLIGWDEILEGGLAPEATVMSWRGMEGGIEAARQRHDVIMTPMSHCYFNFYQGKPEFEPEAFGGYLPLKTVYQFEPTPAELTEEESKFILGGQANLWAEFVPSNENAEYMIFPRIAALAEAVWTNKALCDWNNFENRINRQFVIYDYMKISCAKSIYTVYITPQPDEGTSTLYAALETESSLPEVYFSTDGSEPGTSSVKYLAPIKIENSTTIKASSFIDGMAVSKATVQKFIKHLALLKRPQLKYRNSNNYNGGGDYGLTNGIPGSENFGDGSWTGFHGDDLDAIIDFGEIKNINKISAGFFQKISSWIFLPSNVEYYVSTDGNNYELVSTISSDISDDGKDTIRKDFVSDFAPIKTRYVKVIAKSIGTCPIGHPGAGKKAWLFVDEIIIE